MLSTAAVGVIRVQPRSLRYFYAVGDPVGRVLEQDGARLVVTAGGRRLPRGLPGPVRGQTQAGAKTRMMSLFAAHHGLSSPNQTVLNIRNDSQHFFSADRAVR